VSAFLDTWAWLAVFDDRDPDHVVASVTVSELLDQRRDLITSDYVLSETITALFQDLGAIKGMQLFRGVLEFLDDADISLEWVTPARFAEAVHLRFLYDDKPKISFADLTSMVIMEDLGIHEIITGDRHFLAVNRGFHLLPEV